MSNYASIQPVKNGILRAGNIVYWKTYILNKVKEQAYTTCPTFDNSAVAYSYTYNNQSLGTNTASTHPYNERDAYGNLYATNLYTYSGSQITMMPSEDIGQLDVDTLPIWNKSISISRFYNELIDVANSLFLIRYVTTAWKHIKTEESSTDTTTTSYYTSNLLQSIASKSAYVVCKDTVQERFISEGSDWSSNRCKYLNNAISPRATFSETSIKKFVPEEGDLTSVDEINMLVNKIINLILLQILSSNSFRYTLYTCHYVCHSVCHSNCFCWW